MLVKYDNAQIELTPRFINAVHELMAAECEMMQINDPVFANYWTWGRCKVNDLASADSLEFEYGGDEDLPEDGYGSFAVIVDDKAY